MRRGRALAVLLLALAPRASADESFKDFDAELDLQAALIAGLPACGKGAEAAAAPEFCAPGFPMDKLAADQTSLERVPLDSYYRFGFELYTACLAYAGRDMAVCGRLASVDKALGFKDLGHWGWQRDCWNSFMYSRMAQALAERERPLGRVCREFAGRPSEMNLPIPVFCPLLAEHLDDPEAVCRAASAKADPGPEVTRREFQEHCLFELGTLYGRSDCRTQDDPATRLRCQSLQAYRRAQAAGRPELCEDRVMCRVMMGGGKAACRAFAQSVRKSYCAGERPASCAERAAEIRRKLSVLHRKLREDFEPHDPDGARGRARRIDELRAKLKS